MTTKLFAPGNRARLLLPVVAVVVAAVVTTAPTAQAATARASRALAEGAGMGINPDPQVRIVQRALERQGYDVGAPGNDGRFGPLTAAALRRMQADHGLVVDGIVGGRSRSALGLSRVPGGHPGTRSHAVRRLKTHPAHTGAPMQRPAWRSSAPVTPAATTSQVGDTAAAGTDSLGLAVAAAIIFTTLSAVTGAGFKRRGRAGQARSWPATRQASAESDAGLEARAAARKPSLHLVDSTGAEAWRTGTHAGIPDSGSGAPNAEDSALRLSPGTPVLGYVTLTGDPMISEAESLSPVIEACRRSDGSS